MAEVKVKKVVALIGFMHRTLAADDAPSELIERERDEEFEMHEKDPQYHSLKRAGRIADVVPRAAAAEKSAEKTKK